MSITTDISWCDSTLNMQAGCNGCELWTKKSRICYAGRMTTSYRGRKGWPDAFDKPAIFPDRIKYLKWSDLRGKVRPDKPWIPPDLPRMIFLNDMGDTFTEGLPLDWLSPFIDELATCGHIIQILTKRPKRMYQFFDTLGYVPDNFWLGASVTDQTTANARLPWLSKIPTKIKFVSFEPALELVEFDPSPLSWLIIGGQSGPDYKILDLDNLVLNVFRFAEANVPIFVKQDSGPYPGQRGRISDELWVHEFPGIEVDPAPAQQFLF